MLLDVLPSRLANEAKAGTNVRGFYGDIDPDRLASAELVRAASKLGGDSKLYFMIMPLPKAE